MQISAEAAPMGKMRPVRGGESGFRGESTEAAPVGKMTEASQGGG